MVLHGHQQLAQHGRRDQVLAGKPRAVPDGQSAGIDALTLQEGADASGGSFCRAVRTERPEDLLRIEIVAPVVDDAHDLGQRGRKVYEQGLAAVVAGRCR